jgi:hypothetical protein
MEVVGSNLALAGRCRSQSAEQPADDGKKMPLADGSRFVLRMASLIC